MPYGLLFDVDGVIGDTEPISTSASNKTFLDLYGLRLSDKDHVPYMGATAEKHALGIAQRHHISIDVRAVVESHLHNFLQGLEEAGNIVFPGVHALIAAIGQYEEWKLALATSSSSTRSQATLRAAGVDPAPFVAWITGDDISRPKPDPEIYLAAASALELFPSQCVVIEDSVAGIEAAKAAKMHVVAVTNTFPGEELRQADRIVDTLEAVDVTMLYDLTAGS